MADEAAMSRLADLKRLYELLDRLEGAAGGKRMLGRMPSAKEWPRRGVYFFFEPGVMRTESGEGPRLVRVGTHALGAGAKSTLHQRLRQHRGKVDGGGNHRGSIFRLLIGEALLARGDFPPCPSWGLKGDLSKAAAIIGETRATLADAELPVERAVSRHLGATSILWLPVDDEPGPASIRGHIERNAIALLSNISGPALDPPSDGWLGQFSRRARVRSSGLWNQRHVEESYNSSFLDAFEVALIQL